MYVLRRCILLKTPIVFIAGPYLGTIDPKQHNSSSYLEIEENINAARRVAVYLAQQQIGFFCPHLNSAHFEVLAPEASVDYWYQMDLAILRACDAILMLSKWRDSAGAKQEKVAAQELGIPIYYEDEIDVLIQACLHDLQEEAQ